MLLNTICHSERSEDVLLNEVKNLGNIHVDVFEILRFTTFRSE